MLVIMRRVKEIFIIVFKGLLSLLLLLIIASAIILALDIKLELNHLNKPVEIAVEQVLDRDFSMQGDVVLIPTLWPTLEIKDVSLSNPEGRKWQTGDNLLHFGRLRLQLGLLPLLRGKIYVADMVAEDISLNLESHSDGINNWDFELARKAAEPVPEAVKKEPLFHLEALEKITFKNINVRYYDAAMHKDILFNLEKLDGAILSDKDISIVLNGKLLDKTFAMQFSGAGLDILRDKSREWPLSVQMTIAGTDIVLSGALKQGEHKLLEASLEIGRVDIGATLAWLGVLDGLKMTSEQLSMTARIQGQNLTELIRDAELAIVLNNALWELQDNNTGAQLPIKITQGSITVKPEQAVHIVMDALLDTAKLNIKVSGAPLIDYTRSDLQTPLVMEVQAQHARLRLETKISTAMKVNNLGFKMHLSGEKLSDLNQLSGVDLPPLGPYELQGSFAINPQGYHIKDFLVKVKDSHLKGDLLLDTQLKPPRLKIALNSQQLQINDFEVGEWNPGEEGEKGTIADSQQEKTIEKTHNAKQKKHTARKLLSYDSLSRYNADIELIVEQVLSGQDLLGRGALSLQVNNARLHLHLKELMLSGGNATAELMYQPSGKQSIDIALKTKIKSFDYGILARRIEPQSEVGGLVSVDVDLKSHNAKSLESILINGKGYLDFSWQPEAMNADLFELWAINVISSLLKSTDKDNASKVNCVIGRFIIDDGLMKEKLIYADTTKMRMVGTAEVNFKERSLAVKVAPQAKKAEFFSLATPVGLSGTFDKFKLKINPLGLTKTVVSFITSPVHVPVRRLFNRGLPEDGIEACKVMWKASEGTE